VVEEPVEANMIYPQGALKFDLKKIGMEGLICSSKSLLRSWTTTSDMTGRIADNGGVHNKEMPITFFISSESYLLGFKLWSTNSKCLPLSYNVHACCSQNQG